MKKFFESYIFSEDFDVVRVYVFGGKHIPLPGFLKGGGVSLPHRICSDEILRSTGEMFYLFAEKMMNVFRERFYTDENGLYFGTYLI